MRRRPHNLYLRLAAPSSAPPPLALVSPSLPSPGAGGANPALELNDRKFKTVMAAAAHFAQRNNGDSCLRLMVEALQQGHALGEFLPLESRLLPLSFCGVPQHSTSVSCAPRSGKHGRGGQLQAQL